jgi:hypothetical protein
MGRCAGGYRRPGLGSRGGKSTTTRRNRSPTSPKCTANGERTLPGTPQQPLRHIGLGARLAGTPISLLIDDLHIRVIHRHTGTLIRELTTLDPDLTPKAAPRQRELSKRLGLGVGREAGSPGCLGRRARKKVSRAGSGIAIGGKLPIRLAEIGDDLDDPDHLVICPA